jgi:hypothetical protein
MTCYFSRRLAVSLALVFCLVPLLVQLARPADKPVKNDDFTGKVVPFADLVEKGGGKLDEDASPYWLALVTDQGQIYPLLKDDGSRMFFKDSSLLKRPMRLTGRLLPGSQILQVVQVHSLIKDALHDVYYWCEICSIKRFEKKQCDCCGGPMELREVPVKK